MTRWPAGAKLLQACFWSLRGGGQDRRKHLEYEYSALRPVASDTHERVLNNLTNNFERFGFLRDVASGNEASAMPVIVSEHLSHYFGLELVTGEFRFVRDGKGQLWLAGADNLYLTPTVRTDTATTAVPKIRRYLSEEALLDLKVSEGTGEKCQEMLQLMHKHYLKVREELGVDVILRRVDEIQNVRVPFFEGTDVAEFAKTFDLPARQAFGPEAPPPAALRS